MNDSKSLSQLVQQRFGKFAQGYVTSERHAKGADLDRLVEIAQPQADWHMLDIATGGGHTALKFAPHVAQVIASDLTPEMLNAAEKHLTEKGVNNVTFQRAEAENLPFADAQFDLVTCRIAPHHFTDIEMFVSEAVRVLKSGGLFIVQDQLMPDDDNAAQQINAFEKVRDPSHNRALQQSEWVALFENAGLTVEHTSEFIKRHNFQTWTSMQGCSEAVIAQLIDMANTADDISKGWLNAENWNTPEATFTIHHLIIAGRKQ